MYGVFLSQFPKLGKTPASTCCTGDNSMWTAAGGVVCLDSGDKAWGALLGCHEETCHRVNGPSKTDAGIQLPLGSSGEVIK